MNHPLDFSGREKEVIGLLMQAMSNKQISAALGISTRTVEFHLSRIYARLGVNSRAEAILRLSSDVLRESAIRIKTDQVESAVAWREAASDNGNESIHRRLSVKNLVYISGGVLLLIWLASVLLRPAVPVGGGAAATGTAIVIMEAASPTASTGSSRQQLLEQIRQLARKYEQDVQAEKQNGRVDHGRDPITGQDIFLFRDESYARIDQLYTDFMIQKTQLDMFYTQLDRDELQSTPFPPAPAGQEQAAYDALADRAGAYCSLESWQQDPAAETVRIYQPDDGTYMDIYMGQVIARCEVHGRMLEEFRTAPLLARVDRDADMELIQQVVGNPGLKLNFESMGTLANAPWRSTTTYTDETGTRYYVDVETKRLAQIEPNLLTHPGIPASQRKTLEKLRSLADHFALANSPHLAASVNDLLYEEGNKGDIYFFHWDWRNRDWSGTDWRMMPPFLQVGLLADGRVIIYLNTVDLAGE